MKNEFTPHEWKFKQENLTRFSSKRRSILMSKKRNTNDEKHTQKESKKGTEISLKITQIYLSKCHYF